MLVDLENLDHLPEGEGADLLRSFATTVVERLTVQQAGTLLDAMTRQVLQKLADKGVTDLGSTVNVKETATKFKVSNTAVLSMIHEGVLPAFRINRRTYKVPESAIAAHFAERYNQP
ncbi:helix-turn-helix domain-containing protein [Sphaerisporangium sp. NPDC004334]